MLICADLHDVLMSADNPIQHPLTGSDSHAACGCIRSFDSGLCSGSHYEQGWLRTTCGCGWLRGPSSVGRTWRMRFQLLAEEGMHNEWRGWRCREAWALGECRRKRGTVADRRLGTLSKPPPEGISTPVILFDTEHIFDVIVILPSRSGPGFLGIFGTTQSPIHYLSSFGFPASQGCQSSCICSSATSWNMAPIYETQKPPRDSAAGFGCKNKITPCVLSVCYL